MAMRGFNFSQHVRNSLGVAREEAARLGCDYVFPEHMLLGILAEEQAAGAVIVSNLGVAAEAIIQDIEARFAQRPRKDVASDAALPYTSRGKRVLQAAMDEAYRLGHSYVGTEHLLLGILHDSTGDASAILTGHGVTSDHVHTEIERLIAARTAGAGSAAAAGTTTSGEARRVRLAMLMSALALILAVTAFLLAVIRRP